MADHGFERRLQQLFNEAPAFPDAGAFAAQVEGRLDRGWALRRTAVGVAGALGGALALMQVAGSGWFSRLEIATRSSASEAERHVGGVFSGLANLSPALRAVPIGGEVVWLIAGLAALAVGLLATRALEEI